MDESEQPPAEGVGDGVVRARYDWSSMRPSTAVIESIAAVANCAPTEVEPLYDYVDPDALDAMMQSKSAERDQDIMTIMFTFAEYEVTVYSDGEVVVVPTT